MSAGTLGTKPEQVEATLDSALDLCKIWNAMLLLDEADIFLGARTDTDLARNELVAGERLYPHLNLVPTNVKPTKFSSPSSSTTKESVSLPPTARPALTMPFSPA